MQPDPLTQTDIYRDYCTNHLPDFEGREAHMYLDGPGNVTAGVGHLIASADLAAKLPFTGGGARTDWQKVKQSTPGLRAALYAQLTASRLSDEAINNILQADLAIALRSLGAIYPHSVNYPAPVRLGLVDMTFNMGVHKLSEYPHMWALLDSGLWALAASQTARVGIQDSRNLYVKALFKSAALQAAA